MIGHGCIPSPGNYVKTLTDYALSLGVELVTGEVTEFIQEGDQVTGVKTLEQQSIMADSIAVTSGIWSAGLAKKLGINVQMETERGYHIELINPSIMPRAPMMVTGAKFAMTPMSDRLRLAGVVEFGGLEAEPTAAAHELLRKKIKETLPGITWQDENIWFGHRPAPVDSTPLIGKVDPIKGLYIGCGHHHVGLTGGPRTGQLLAQSISDQTPDIDLTPYRPSRFGTP
jgi:D-amino-acid dehydrogenase